MPVERSNAGRSSRAMAGVVAGCERRRLRTRVGRAEWRQAGRQHDRAGGEEHRRATSLAIVWNEYLRHLRLVSETCMIIIWPLSD